MTETTLFHLEDIELMRGQRRTLLFERAQLQYPQDINKISVIDHKIRKLRAQLFELTKETIYQK